MSKYKEFKLPTGTNWHYIYCENCACITIMIQTEPFRGKCTNCGIEGKF